MPLPRRRRRPGSTIAATATIGAGRPPPGLRRRRCRPGFVPPGRTIRL